MKNLRSEDRNLETSEQQKKQKIDPRQKTQEEIQGLFEEVIKGQCENFRNWLNGENITVCKIVELTPNVNLVSKPKDNDTLTIFIDKDRHTIDDIGKLIEQLKATKVDVFKLNYLPFKNHTVDANEVYRLSKTFLHTNISVIMMKEERFFTDTAVAFVKGLRGSSVKDLYFGPCRLAERPGSKFKEIYAFGKAFRGTDVNFVCLKYNGFDSDGMVEFARGVKGSSVLNINFGGRYVTRGGLVSVISAFQASQVREISLTAIDVFDREEEQQLPDEDDTVPEHIVEEISDELAVIIQNTSLVNVNVENANLNPKIFAENRKRLALPYYLYGLQFLSESDKAKHTSLTTEEVIKQPARAAAGILMRNDLPQDVRNVILNQFPLLAAPEDSEEFKETCVEVAEKVKKRIGAYKSN